MRDEQVAREYARALFEVAVEKNKLEAVSKEIDTVLETLSDPEFEGFFQSVKFNSEAKKSVFNKAFLHDVSTITRNYFWVVFDNKRENLLNSMQNEFDRLVDEHSKQMVAKLVTAVPVNDKLVAQVKKQLEQATNKTVEVEAVVDSTIGGGMMIYTDGQVIDASVKSRLNDLRDKLVQTR
ncbi:MAG: ATP synthase F1 subunit delta [Rubrobacteridae bacterium]|nr:ATP synthase F1 subunit delta [Rubrobacteridae bacterium]